MLTTEKDSTSDKIYIAEVELNFLNRSVLFLGESIATTGLEFNLLAVLMADAGSLVSRPVIAQRIFNRELSRCDKSINSHITNLRKKLLAISSRPVIKTVKGRGYIFLTDNF